MFINGEWKNKVRTMRANGDNEGAKRELRKAKMSEGYIKANDKDKIFIDYCLAHYSYKEKDFEIANRYLSEIEFMFSDTQKISEMNLEYCNFTWLYVNVNYNVMTIEKIIDNMTYVYNYYSEINEQDIAITALENIFRFDSNSEKVLECLEELMKCESISDLNFIDSILKDCDNISHNLYIKACGIVNKYKFNIDAI